MKEASSGEYLLQEFGEHRDVVIPLIRKTEVKYHRSANGILFSRASFPLLNKAVVLDELMSRNRAVFQIKVELYDSNSRKVLTAVFNWFLKKKE